MNRRGEVNSKEAEVNKKFAWNFIWRMGYFMVFGSEPSMETLHKALYNLQPFQHTTLELHLYTKIHMKKSV